jgi:hypothetical protein
MPIHIRAGIGDLRLPLFNKDDVLDSQVAATPQEANRIGIMMLASRDALNHGDTLTCRRAVVDGAPLPPRGPGGGR